MKPTTRTPVQFNFCANTEALTSHKGESQETDRLERTLSTLISAVAKVMGQKNWKTTVRYTHTTDEGKRRVVEAQERELRNAGHKRKTAAD